MKYEDAMKQLESIVSDIEAGRLDIDLISEKLREAQQLITFCKAKLTATEESVKQILTPAE